MKNTFKGWIARDSSGRLLFYTDKPWRCTNSWGVSEGEWMEIEKSWFPDVNWHNEPKEVKLTIDDMCIDEVGNTMNNREYCKEHCKGFQESGGKCYFDDDCEEKKAADKILLVN